MDRLYIFFAAYLFIFSFLIALFFFFKLSRKQQIEMAILGMMCAAIAYGVALLAGQMYNDPRPFVEGHFKPLIAHDTENGFPSDHVLMLSVIAAVYSIFNKPVAIILWAIASLVGYARVYTGVHHYIDVLASMLIAIFVTWIIYALINKNKLPKLTGNVNNFLKRFGLDYK